MLDNPFSNVPTPLDLAGMSLLELQTREAGAKIGRLFLTYDPQQQP
jgi:hypothetical protein